MHDGLGEVSAGAPPDLVAVPLRPAAGGSAHRERADAARNRGRILAAAAELFGEHGVDRVSLDAIAERASVGKGTVFRRFGDKAGLAAALLDDRDRDLQQRILSGPPPLGPGAPPQVRIVAFFDAYLELIDASLDLLRLSETASPGARFRVGSYRFWWHHLVILLTEAEPAVDAEVTAHLLLAPLGADLHCALRDRGVPADRAREAVAALVARLVG